MIFEDLGLSEETLKAVKERGYESPTPIQAKAIPAIQMTRDVVGLAQTGTGKTASFTLPMIDALSQTLLFSATMPPEIKKLTEKFLSNPKEVTVAAAASPAETVEQFLVKLHIC